MRVIEMDPADARWDRYVATHPGGLVYHHSRWIRALQHEYGQPPLGLALEDSDGGIRGVLPLMRTRGLALGPLTRVARRRLASLPRTPVAGPLADDRSGLLALTVGARERTPPGTQLQLKVSEPDLDGLVDDVAGHAWRLTYVLELPDRPEQLRFGNSRNHSRLRWAVNKARREGVHVRPADSLDEVRQWYRLYLDTMRHHAVPARPRRLFEFLWQELRPAAMMRLLLAERDGQMLAGCVLLGFNSTVFYAFSGVERTAFAQRPNDVLQWEAIKGAVVDGYRRYDFGEVVEHHQGLAEFKSKWGSQPVRLHRYYHPPPELAPDPGDGEPSRALTLAAESWRRLPLRVTALASDRVYRYL